MSIKRSKARSSSRRRDGGDDEFHFGAGAEPEKSWDQHMEGQPDDAFTPYSMGATFAKGALLNHVKFGKGVVLEIEGAHVNVLFAEGVKKLGHGRPAP